MKTDYEIEEEKLLKMIDAEDFFRNQKRQKRVRRKEDKQRTIERKRRRKEKNSLYY